MQIPQNEVVSTKKIGHLGSNPVYAISTVGGLHLIMTKRAGVTSVLSAGSHMAIARHIARKKEPNLVIDELSKADYIPEEYFVDLVPEFEQLTDDLNARLK